MTVVVAALTEQGVVMAADRQIHAGWQKQYHEQPKLWVNGKYALGAAGCMRTAQVLKHHVTWPKYRPDEDTDWEAFLVKTLVPAMWQGVKDHGVVKNNNGIDQLNSSLLLAVGDRIAEISGNGCAVTETAGRAAIGSGYAEALGALGTTGPWTEDQVIDAVRRASQTAVGVGGPISIVNTRTLDIRTVDE